MTETTVDTDTSQLEFTPSETPPVDGAVTWLEAEFPGWTIDIDHTASWEGSLRPLWVARSPGHHPQAELTAAKLHTRLSDYLDREARRQALRN